jgi:hypothetical protein
VSSKQQPSKIGAGHVKAMLRSGFKEVSRILPAFPQSIQPIEEPGLFGNPVPQEIFDEKNMQKQVDEPEMEMGM